MKLADRIEHLEHEVRDMRAEMLTKKDAERFATKDDLRALYHDVRTDLLRTTSELERRLGDRIHTEMASHMGTIEESLRTAMDACLERARAYTDAAIAGLRES